MSEQEEEKDEPMQHQQQVDDAQSRVLGEKVSWQQFQVTKSVETKSLESFFRSKDEL